MVLEFHDNHHVHAIRRIFSSYNRASYAQCTFAFMQTSYGDLVNMYFIVKNYPQRLKTAQDLLYAHRR